MTHTMDKNDATRKTQTMHRAPRPTGAFQSNQKSKTGMVSGKTINVKNQQHRAIRHRLKKARNARGGEKGNFAKYNAPGKTTHTITECNHKARPHICATSARTNTIPRNRKSAASRKHSREE